MASDDSGEGQGRGYLWWFGMGALAGIAFAIIRRPAAAIGCGCLLVVIGALLLVGLWLAYPAPTLAAIIALVLLIAWLRQRNRHRG